MSAFHAKTIPSTHYNSSDMSKFATGIVSGHTYQHQSDGSHSYPFERHRTYEQQVHAQVRHKNGSSGNYGYHTRR